MTPVIWGIRPDDAEDLLQAYAEFEREDAKIAGGYPGEVWEATTPIVGFTSGDNPQPIAWSWEDLRSYVEELK